MSPSRPSRRVAPDRSFDLKEQLRQLCRIGVALTAERDLGRLLDLILHEARRFARAEAGTLYVRASLDGTDVLRFCAVQNDAIPASAVPASAGGLGAIPITRRSIAGYVAATGQVLNIRDVYAIPATEEYAFNDEFDRRTGYRTESMLAVPMMGPGGGAPVGVIQLINARPNLGQGVAGFDPRIADLVLSLASQAAVALTNAQLTEDLKRAYEETIVRLARAAEVRDADTGEHIRRMSRYAAEIARELGWPEDRVAALLLAAPLHDVGKIAVPDAILKKAGALTPAERAEIERHTTHGAAILDGSDVPVLQLAREIALSHHERWDGGGYPARLAGEAIPIAGRICALADVFDALTSRRVYKEPMPVEEACERIREGRGAHFDPAVVDAFFRAFDRILAIRARYAS